MEVFASGFNTLAFSSQKDPYFYFFGNDQIISPSIDDTIRDQFNIDITAIDITPCGGYVVTGHANGKVILWDTRLRIRVAFCTVSDNSSVVSVAIQSNVECMYVALNNNQIHRLSMTSVMSYMTIKTEDSMTFESPITHIKTAASCDSSLNFIVVAFVDRVRIISSSGDMKEVAEYPFENPKVAFSSYEWSFYLVVASKSTICVYETNDNGETSLINTIEFDSVIVSTSFVTRKLFAVLFANRLVVYHINGTECLSTPNSFVNSQGMCSVKGSILLPPINIISIETWDDRIEMLKKSGHFHEAIQTSLQVYMGECIEFDCYDEFDKLQEKIQGLLMAFIESGARDQHQLLLIAEAAVNTGSGQFLLRNGFSKLVDSSIEQPLIIALLRAATNHSELAPSIVRKAMEIDDVDPIALESFLINVSLPPSFTQEAIAFARKKNFNRFLLHHFDSVYDNVFPIFSQIIETGSRADISTVCKAVFLQGDFSKEKSNVCIVWLFDPGLDKKYKRLKKVFESDWNLSSKLVEEFLQRCPIVFSRSQSLDSVEIITIATMCFSDAPKGDSDSLFSVLAQNLLNRKILVPPESIQNILTFVFESSSPRSLREELFLRIVDKDYEKEVLLKDYSGLCVAAGFSKAAERHFLTLHDYESMITAMLLSDTPNDAHCFLENQDIDPKNLLPAICSRFTALLFLNPSRFIRIVLSRFREIHPSYIRTINNPAAVIVYHNELFGEEHRSNANQSDAEFYLEFLSKNSLNNFISFLKSPKPMDNIQVLEFCESRNLFIGCSVVYTEMLKWENSFEYYARHIQSGGIANTELVFQILDHINDISLPPSQIIRLLISPLIFLVTDRVSEIIKQFLEKACSLVDRNEVLLAILPVIISCPSDRAKIKNTLVKFIKGFATIHNLDPQRDGPLIKAINHISTACEGKTISNGKVVAADGKDGVTMLSTFPVLNYDEMESKTVEEVKVALQKAESISVNEGKRIPQDKEATIVLLYEK